MSIPDHRNRREIVQTYEADIRAYTKPNKTVIVKLVELQLT